MTPDEVSLYANTIIILGALATGAAVIATIVAYWRKVKHDD